MSKFRDQLRIEGVNARGYGIIPKMVVLDRKLTIEAKAIYAYFCSYAGAGTTAFPSVNKIISDLCISKDRYYNHFNKLKELGYISVEQVRDKGIFKHNIYTLVTNPESQKMKSEESKPVDNLQDKPCPENKDTDELQSNTDFQPCPDNPDTVHPDTGNKDSNSNNLLYNQQSLLKSINHSKTKETNERKNEDKEILNSLLDKLDLDDFKDKQVNDLAIKRAIEILWYKKSIKNNGITVYNKQIRNDLKLLNYNHLVNASNIFIKESERQEIKNRIGYLAMCIYNSIFDIDMSIHNQIHNN